MPVVGNLSVRSAFKNGSHWYFITEESKNGGEAETKKVSDGSPINFNSKVEVSETLTPLEVKKLAMLYIDKALG